MDSINARFGHELNGAQKLDKEHLKDARKVQLKLKSGMLGVVVEVITRRIAFGGKCPFQI